MPRHSGVQLTQEDQSAALTAPQPAAKPFLCTPAVSPAALNPVPQAPTVAISPPLRPFLPGSLLPPQAVGLFPPGLLTTISNPQGLRQGLEVLPLGLSRAPEILQPPDVVPLPDQSAPNSQSVIVSEAPASPVSATAGYMTSSAECQMGADYVPVNSIGSPVAVPSPSGAPSADEQSSEPSQTESAVMEIDALPDLAAPSSPLVSAPASSPTIILPLAESHALQTAEMETCTEAEAPPKQNSPLSEGGRRACLQQ